MEIIRSIHATFGERILPLLIIIAAIWFTVAWRPGDQGRNAAARFFPILVDLQVTLGIIWWLYGLVAGFGIAAGYLSFPFLLHPILGLISAGIAHMAVKPDGPFRRFGRWSALTGLVVLLVSVMAGIVIANRAA